MADDACSLCLRTCKYTLPGIIQNKATHTCLTSSPVTVVWTATFFLFGSSFFLSVQTNAFENKEWVSASSTGNHQAAAGTEKKNEHARVVGADHALERANLLCLPNFALAHGRAHAGRLVFF